MRWFFYCFLTNIFQITFKYFQNIIRLCFHFVKFRWEKYNMLGADEDGRICSFFITNCWYTFSNANGIEKLHNFCTKIFNFVQFNHKNHCCNVSLYIMMKPWKYSMANILNCCTIFFFFFFFFFKFVSIGKNYLEAFNFSVFMECSNKGPYIKYVGGAPEGFCGGHEIF